MRATYKVFRELALTDPKAGVQIVQGFEYFENPPEPYLKLQGRYADIDGFTVLEKSELPPNVQFGTTYETWCLNPPHYLAWLEKQLVVHGVRFVRSNLVNILDATTVMNEREARTIINCSGIGIADLKSLPIRGNVHLHTVLTG